MRWLVCGGRDFTDQVFVNRTLDKFDFLYPALCVITGGAFGVDHLATNWAKSKGISWYHFMAEWKKHGRSAGPIRNKRMLEEGKPDLVIAFPGGKGTANMIAQARKAGVSVYEVSFQVAL